MKSEERQWGGKASCNQLITAIMPNDSPLRISWSIPWAQSRHSYEESHQQKFYLIYCYRSWILSAKSRRKKKKKKRISQKDNEVGYFSHFVLKYEQWSLGGWGGAVSSPGAYCSLKGSNCTLSAQKFSIQLKSSLSSSEDQRTGEHVLRPFTHFLMKSY